MKIADIDLSAVKHSDLDYNYFGADRRGAYIFGGTLTSATELDKARASLKNARLSDDKNDCLSHIDGLLSQYGADFFNDSVLVIFTYSESSGSVTYTPKSLERNKKGTYISVERDAPTLAGIQVMAGGIYFVAVDREFYGGSDIGVNVYQKHNN